MFAVVAWKENVMISKEHFTYFVTFPPSFSQVTAVFFPPSPPAEAVHPSPTAPAEIRGHLFYPSTYLADT